MFHRISKGGELAIIARICNLIGDFAEEPVSERFTGE
jgi:hypothetical protein